MSNLNSATIENTIFDSRDAVKLTVNKDFENKESNIVIDGWNYGPAEIDLKQYKYLAVSYYIDGNLPEGKWRKLSDAEVNKLRGKGK